MNRIPAHLVLLMLHQEADRTGHERFRIAPGTLRSWTHRGHISRNAEGYDLGEILKYLESRKDITMTATITEPEVEPQRVCPAPCAMADDVCPTYGGEFCPDNQALIDACKHC